MPKMQPIRATCQVEVLAIPLTLTDTMRGAAGDIPLWTPNHKFLLGALPAGATVLRTYVANVVAPNAPFEFTVGTNANADNLMASTIATTTTNTPAAPTSLVHLANPALVYMKTDADNAAVATGSIIVAIEFVRANQSGIVSVMGLDTVVNHATPVA